MQPIKVVFLVFYFEAWDALAPVYELMLSDSRFAPQVVTINRKLTGDSEFGGEEKVSQFFDDLEIEHLRLNDQDSWSDNDILRNLEPDYVFVNYPWQRNYPPGFRPDALAEFTRIAFIPYYSLPIVNEPGDHGVAKHLYTQRTHQLASLVFTQDEDINDAYAETERGKDYVHFTGSPKIDSLMRAASDYSEWPLPQSDRYKIVWAPHHSYSPAWFNFGVFATMHEAMFEFAKSNTDIDVVLRPHPFLLGTLVDREVLSVDALEEWLKRWNSLSNTAVDESGNYAKLFHTCDLLITDGISFLGEYPLITKKPAVFIENSGHWGFTALGETAANANIRVTSFDEFVAGFKWIREAGLPDRAEQIEALEKAACPYPGEAAKRIAEITAKHFESGAGLVDKKLVTELAWELQAGREPID